MRKHTQPTRSSTRTHRRAATAAPAASSGDAGATLEFKAYYDRYLEPALALPEAQVAVFRTDAALVLHNVRIGVSAVTGQEERIGRELPSIHLEPLIELPELAGALVYASTLVTQPVSRREIAETIARISPLRMEMLSTAEAFARRNVLPADRVKAIRAGTGKLDMALDAVALAGLYIEYKDVLAGQHMFTREEITSLGRDGERLVQAITPHQGRSQKPAPSPTNARTIRDRLYTLVVTRHNELRRVASFLWGDQGTQFVPRLNSRQLGTRTSTADSTDGNAPVISAPPAATTPAPTA
jgi:hypothetical protein